MQNLFCLFIASILSLSSCISNSKDDDIPTISIAIDASTPATLKEIASTVQFIPLKESKSVSIIGQAQNVVQSGDKLVILDRFSKSIIVYSLNGDYLYSIKKHGQAPDEFTNISDFYIYKNNIVISDNQSLKLLSYKLDNGSFVRSVKFPFVPFNNCIQMNENYLILVGVIEGRKEDDKFQMILTDDKFNVLSKHIPYQGGSSAVFGTGLPFQSVGNEISILPVYEQIIYGFNGKEVYPKIKLDFGKHNIDKTDLLTNPKYTGDSKWLFKDIKNLNSIYFFDFHESSEYYWFFYTFKGDKYSYLYNKKSKSGRQIKHAVPAEISFSNQPIGVINDSFVFISNESQFDWKDFYNKGLINETTFQLKEKKNTAILVLVKPSI